MKIIFISTFFRKFLFINLKKSTVRPARFFGLSKANYKPLTFKTSQFCNLFLIFDLEAVFPYEALICSIFLKKRTDLCVSILV